MPRLLLAALTLLCLAVAAAPAAGAKPHARAVLDSCEKATIEEDGTGVFEGRMRTLRDAERMQMRFTLQTRLTSDDRWTAVAAPGFGVWTTSEPGTSRYVYTKRVENLLAPGAYRVAVRFRWLDSSGDTLTSMREYSPPCRQPDPRPDLVVRGIGVEAAADPARRHYVVLVRNNGRTPAGASTLALTVGTEPQPPAVVPPLAVGEGTLVTLEGPSCQEDGQLVADADADDAIDERDEADNVFTRSCPRAAS